jgi:hypothetical protein
MKHNKVSETFYTTKYLQRSVLGFLVHQIPNSPSFLMEK